MPIFDKLPYSLCLQGDKISILYYVNKNYWRKKVSAQEMDEMIERYTQ
jgi:hypothetical protein